MLYERRARYERLSKLIGGTPLTELGNIVGDLPCRIFLKQECRNPTGSHYDRIMLELLRCREEQGEIEVGSTLLDTTTGNSGASLAWLSRALGFTCNLIIPRDAPPTRIQQIEAYGGNVSFSPAHKYTDGLIDVLSTRLRARETNDVLLDHAADEDGPVTAMENLGIEIREQFATSYPGQDLHLLVVALGNGASVNVGRPLVDDGCRVVGFEPMQAPTHFLEMHSMDEIIRRYGKEPTLSLDHGLWGTGAGTRRGFPWPIMQRAWDLLDDIELVAEDDWNTFQVRLADEEGLHMGRSTAAGVAVALRVAERTSYTLNIVCLAYDPAWKYLGTGNGG
jgi:cysteine synthase A